MSLYAAGTITRRAISTATSGIDYKSNGSIGWSNDKFRAGIKSGAVNGTLGSAGQKSDFLKNNEWARSGMTSFVNKTLDFEEGGWNNVMPGWMPGLIKDKEALRLYLKIVYEEEISGSF